MKNEQSNHSHRNSGLFSVFGAPSDGKASGLSYSLATVLQVVLSFVFVVVAAALGLSGQGSENSDAYLYLAFLLPQLSYAAVAFWAVRYTEISLRKDVAKPCAAKYYVIAVVLQIGLFSLSQLNVWFLQLLEKFGYQNSEILLPSMDGFGLFGVLLVVAVLPAVFEEFFFRGVLLRGLRAFGEVGAVLLCGAFFSLYHQNPAQTLYQFFCGAAFALVALRSGSILPTVLSHFFNNALIILLEKFSLTTFSTPVLIVVMSVSVCCLIFSLLYLLVLDKNKLQQPFIALEERQVERKNIIRLSLFGVLVNAVFWLMTLAQGM